MPKPSLLSFQNLIISDGWLKMWLRQFIGFSNAKIVAGPHVYGGMSMPVEMITEEVELGLAGKKSVNVPPSAIMG